MKKVVLLIKDIPHGHGLSTKRGISDGLLDRTEYEGKVPNGHDASYQRGVGAGKDLMQQINDLVKE